MQVVENTEKMSVVPKRQATTAATQKDPITNNESGSMQMKMEAMLRAEKEHEAKKVRFEGRLRAPLNEALGMAAIGLQEARKDQDGKTLRRI